MDTVATRRRHTFTILNMAGQRKDGLIRSFLRTAELTRFDKNFVTDDGTEWPLYKELDLQEDFEKEDTILCIISFQSFKDGEYFCVARRFDENVADRRKVNQNG